MGSPPSPPSLSRRLFGRWSWSRPLRSAALVYLSLLLVALFFADFLIFVPPRQGYTARHPRLVMLDPPPSSSQDAGAGQRVAALWYPPPDDKAPVLLWSHGNAEDIGYLDPLLEDFAGRGFGLLAYDYPGYGLSEGRPDERGCYRAAATAYQHLTSALGVPPERILLLGQSVGSGPALWLAEREPGVRGLVLISPFLSAFRVITRVPLFPRDRFPNARRIPTISTPLLVIHGQRDEVIPFSHGKALHALHPGPAKSFVPLPGTGHNDLWAIQFEEVFHQVARFAAETAP